MPHKVFEVRPSPSHRFSDDDIYGYKPAHKIRRPIWRLRRVRYLVALTLVLCIFGYYSSTRHTPLFQPRHEPSLRYKNVEWRRYAYSLYADDSAYLCNAVMVFEALARLGSKADRVLMYPEELGVKARDRDRELLDIAENWYGVKLRPVKREDLFGERQGEVFGAVGSLGIFSSFGLDQYERVLFLESDITLFKHLDDLFLLPPAQVAATRAYWTMPSKNLLSTHLTLLEPSLPESKRVHSALEANTALSNTTSFDTDIFSTLYSSSALLLPHRHYALQTHEFRRPGPLNHSSFLGNTYEKWDSDRILQEASLVHFSDSPLPKPWVMWPNNLLMEIRPKCDVNPGTESESGCRNREAWIELYNDFRRRRKDVCKLLSVPAPEWPPRPTKAEQEAKAKVEGLKEAVKDPEKADDTALDRVKALQAQMKAGAEAEAATAEKTTSGVSKALADKARAEMRKSYSGATEEKAAEVNKIGVSAGAGLTGSASESSTVSEEKKKETTTVEKRAAAEERTTIAVEKKLVPASAPASDKESIPADPSRYELPFPAILVNEKGEPVNEEGDSKDVAEAKRRARGAMRRVYKGRTAEMVDGILGG